MQNGFSLLEVSVSLAILGVLAVALTRFAAGMDDARDHQDRSQLMERVEQALTSYVYREHRLPCPATDVQGVADCSGGDVGRVPWQTLGLPDRDAGELRYAAYAEHASNAALTRSRDRFEPVELDNGSPQRAALTQPSANLVDTCALLHRLADRAASPSRGQVRIDRAAGERAVAYAIAAPGNEDADGDGSLFDGHQASSQPVFDWPGRPRSDQFDDQIRAVGFADLAGRLACAHGLNAVGRSHFNAAVSAASLERTIRDYEALMGWQVELAELRVDQAEAELTSLSARTTVSAGQALFGAAELWGATFHPEDPPNAEPFGFALGIASVALHAGMIPVVAVMTNDAQGALASARQQQEAVEELHSEAESLRSDIRANAVDADAQGF
jgi:prepilin-type N-terminal cleavage/methylation domain-containing protein